MAAGHAVEENRSANQAPHSSAVRFGNCLKNRVNPCSGGNSGCEGTRDRRAAP
jgi:hypothetical protein